MMMLCPFIPFAECVQFIRNRSVKRFPCQRRTVGWVSPLRPAVLSESVKFPGSLMNRLHTHTRAHTKHICQVSIKCHPWICYVSIRSEGAGPKGPATSESLPSPSLDPQHSPLPAG